MLFRCDVSKARSISFFIIVGMTEEISELDPLRNPNVLIITNTSLKRVRGPPSARVRLLLRVRKYVLNTSSRAYLHTALRIQEEEQPFTQEIHHEKVVNSTTQELCSPKNIKERPSQEASLQNSPLVLAYN